MSRDAAFMELALAGESATRADFEAYLVAFHAAHPDATERVYDVFAKAGGIDPYDRLALALARTGKAELLDIGCGGGALLERFLRRVPTARVSGIDLSPDEIVRARKRIPKDRVRRLDTGNANALLFADASFDVVTSHMVFMLLPDVAPAFAEIRRVLAPGGALTFLVGRPPDAGDPTAAILGAIPEWIRETHASFVAADPGDPRMRGRESISATLAEAGFDAIAFDDFVVEATLSPEEMWETVERRYYAGSLAPDETQALRARLFERLGGRPHSYRDHLRIVEARG